MERICCVLFLCITGCLSMNFVYTDCNKDHTSLHLDSVRLSPYPLHIPGDFKLSAHLVLGRNLSGNIKVEVKFHKKILFWIPIPCVKNIGSCTYDLCSILNTQFVHNGVTQCPSKWAKQGLPCSCPIKAGTYTLNPDVWTIPAPSALLSSMSAGDYKIDVKVTNKDTGEQLGCYHIEITLTHPCSGFACIFG